MRYCVALTVLFVAGCGGSRPPVYTPDPVVPKLEDEFKKLKKEIDEVQVRVRSLLGKIVDDIERDRIDPTAAAVEARQTAKQIREIRDRVRDVRNRRGSSGGGPTA